MLKKIEFDEAMQEKDKKIQKKKEEIILLGFPEKERKLIKKILGKKFEIKDVLEDEKEYKGGIILSNRGNVVIGRANFISRAQKMIDKNREKEFILFNIMIRYYDTLVSHLGIDTQDKIEQYVLRKLLYIFNKTGKYLIGKISERKFMVLKEISDLKDGKERAREEGERIAKTIIENITSDRINISGRYIIPSVNIGVSIYKYDGEKIPELAKSSELALQESIDEGANIFEVFSEEMRSLSSRKTFLIDEILDGMNLGKIYPVFQPIFSLEDMRIKGYELLIRWKDKQISPEDIIRVSEELGLIREINDFLSRKISEISWKLPKYFFSFNINVRSILEDKIFNSILENMQKYMINPTRICFEISEKSDYKEISKAKERLSEIRRMGFLIALDDFGSPQTLISHIKDIPADIIKIDKEILKAIDGKDDILRMIVEGIVYISHKTGKNVVIEGIEMESELKLARELKCDMAQGFALCPPMTEEEVLGE